MKHQSYPISKNSPPSNKKYTFATAPEMFVCAHGDQILKLRK